MGRGYEDNKSSTDQVGLNGIVQSSVSTSSGSLGELCGVYLRGNSLVVLCSRTFRRAKPIKDVTVGRLGEGCAGFECTLFPRPLRVIPTHPILIVSRKKGRHEQCKRRCGIPKAFTDETSLGPFHKVCEPLLSLVAIPADGVGEHVYQTRWATKGIADCYWVVTRTSLKNSSTHGKAWGRLVWRGLSLRTLLKTCGLLC